MEFVSGFISVVGSPNVGKSSIINKIVGEKVSIVSPKPQTTRSCVRGILTGGDFQMILLDTPGLMLPKNMLNETMVKHAYDTLSEVDGIVMVLDATVGLRLRDQELLKNLMKRGVPLFVAINKIDITSAGMIDSTCEAIKEQGFEGRIFTISAAKDIGINKLFESLKRLLPTGPKYYPEDLYTDSPEKFIAGEIIREKALLSLEDEIPHGIGVEIEKVEKRENKDLMDVYAVIYCERKSHKNIVIGHGGLMLKKIGSDARMDLEMLFGMRVYLKLFVKVKVDWRNSASVLKTLGYE